MFYVEPREGTMKLREVVPSEDHEQGLLVYWLRSRGIRFYAIPNGGKRELIEAVKFKRTGVSAGVPDLCIPIPSGGYHGLYIELKRVVGGTVSEKQQEWLDFLEGQGYYAKVAKGFDEARDMVMAYLALTRPAA